MIKYVDSFNYKEFFVVIYEFAEGECLFDHWNFDRYKKTKEITPLMKFKSLPIEKRLNVVEKLFSFFETFIEYGYVAVDFYDSSIMYDFKNDVVTFCDIDLFRKLPTIDDLGKDYFGTKRLKAPEEKYEFKITGKEKMKNRPIIIGAGPAGLFSAYMLAKHGYKPLILERGEKVENRVKTVEKFWKEGILNKNSNVQFGEGGAGTFSDGKLNTLVKDKFYRNKKVLEIFVNMGAPEEILYINKPHIGTDLLRDVIINLRNEIIKMGGEIRYNSCLTNVEIQNSSIKSIEINNSEKIDTEVLILAIGHSARDTFRLLKEKGLFMESKPFAVGVRVQHSQEKINYAQYGNAKNLLPPASYKLTYHASNGRGVYSFCMCPGGFVVNASSEEKRLAINGMSNFDRDEKNANSAIVVTVSPEDFENKIFGGLEFQEKLEEKTYKLGNGKIPIQTLKDFFENKKSMEINELKPVIKGNYELSNLQEILPEFMIDALKEAFKNFDKKIKGFADDDTILAAIETRTSSPVRIVRNLEGESNIKGIYPAGEGAGYAGGIMSAAMDGIKTAENIAKIYLR